MLRIIKITVGNMGVDNFSYTLGSIIFGIALLVVDGISYFGLFLLLGGLGATILGYSRTAPRVIQMGFGLFALTLTLFLGGIGLVLLKGPDLVNILFVFVGLIALLIGLLEG